MKVEQYMELQFEMKMCGVKEILSIEGDKVQCVNQHDAVVCLDKEKVQDILDEAILSMEWNEWRNSAEYRG